MLLNESYQNIEVKEKEFVMRIVTIEEQMLKEVSELQRGNNEYEKEIIQLRSENENLQKQNEALLTEKEQMQVVGDM